MLCRKSAAELTSIKPTLDEMGIGLVAIGSGSPLMAKSFQDQFKFTGDLYVDPTRRVYQALDCKRGVKFVFGRKAMGKIKQAIGEGHMQGKTQGDGMQLGGVFIMSSKGIHWQHAEKFAGDHASNEAILEECRGLVSPAAAEDAES